MSVHKICTNKSLNLIGKKKQTICIRSSHWKSYERRRRKILFISKMLLEKFELDAKCFLLESYKKQMCTPRVRTKNTHNKQTHGEARVVVVSMTVLFRMRFLS